MASFVNAFKWACSAESWAEANRRAEIRIKKNISETYV